MAGLKPRILIGGVWTDVGARVIELNGSPLISAVLLEESLLVPDVYELVFSDVVPEVSALVHVSTGSVVNPHTGLSRSVLLDGATEYDDVVPGLVIVFSDDPSFSDSWHTTLECGLALGIAPLGTTGAGFAVQVENTGLDVGSGCKARLLPVVKRVRLEGKVFATVNPFAEGASQKVVDDSIMPYLFEVSGVSGSGDSKTMDLEVDGDPLTVLNVATNVQEASNDLNVTDWYRVVEPVELQGEEFKLSEDAVNGNQENVLVFEPNFIEIAVSDSGAPGPWGVSDVDLTEDGFDVGTITAGGLALFFVRLVVGSLVTVKSSPWPCCVALEGNALSAAGWN